MFRFYDVKTATVKNILTESCKYNIDDGISVFMSSKQSVKAQRDSEIRISCQVINDDRTNYT